MVKKIRKINKDKRKGNRGLAKILSNTKKEINEERKNGMKLVFVLSFSKEYCERLPTTFALQLINLNSKPVLLSLNQKGFTGINLIVDLRGDSEEEAINNILKNVNIEAIKNPMVRYDWMLIIRVDDEIMKNDLLMQLSSFIMESNFDDTKGFIFSPNKVFNCFHSSFNPENISNDLMKIMKETGEEKAIKLVE